MYEQEEEWWIDYSTPMGPVVEADWDFTDLKRYIAHISQQWGKQMQIAFAPLHTEFERIGKALDVEIVLPPPQPNTRKTYGPQPRSTFSRNGRKNY